MCSSDLAVPDDARRTDARPPDDRRVARQNPGAFAPRSVPRDADASRRASARRTTRPRRASARRTTRPRRASARRPTTSPSRLRSMTDASRSRRLETPAGRRSDARKRRETKPLRDLCAERSHCVGVRAHGSAERGHSRHLAHPLHRSSPNPTRAYQFCLLGQQTAQSPFAPSYECANTCRNWRQWLSHPLIFSAGILGVRPTPLSRRRAGESAEISRKK